MSQNDRKPITPVAPIGMEVIFLYECPYCLRKLPVLAPKTPAVIHCESCGNPFPILPVEGRAIDFIKLVCAGGPAAVDPTYT